MFYKRVQNDLSEVFTEEEFLEKAKICIIGINNVDFSTMSAKELYDLYTFALINMEYNKQGYLEQGLKAFPEYRQTGSFSELAGYDKREGFKMYNFAVHYMEKCSDKRCEELKKQTGINLSDIMLETRTLFKDKKWNKNHETRIKELLKKVKEINDALEENKE